MSSYAIVTVRLPIRVAQLRPALTAVDLGIAQPFFTREVQSISLHQPFTQV